MLVKTLKKLLENTNTQIKKVNFVSDIDPFILSPTKIRLNVETFLSEDDIIKKLAGKNIVAKDVKDPEDDTSKLNVLYFISEPYAKLRRIKEERKKSEKQNLVGKTV